MNTGIIGSIKRRSMAKYDGILRLDLLSCSRSSFFNFSSVMWRPRSRWLDSLFECPQNVVSMMTWCHISLPKIASYHKSRSKVLESNLCKNRKKYNMKCLQSIQKLCTVIARVLKGQQSIKYKPLYYCCS